VRETRKAGAFPLIPAFGFSLLRRPTSSLPGVVSLREKV